MSIETLSNSHKIQNSWKMDETYTVNQKKLVLERKLSQVKQDNVAKIFATWNTEKGLFSNIYKEYLQIYKSEQKVIYSIKKFTETHRVFTEKKIDMVHK